MTLAQDGDVIEGTGYYAYGKQRELLSASQTGSETSAREKFTGKELDKEGMGCQVSLDIHLYNGSFNPYVLGVFKIFFTDGDSSVHLMDISGTDLHLTRDIPFYQARTVDKLYLLVSNITPAISYKLDIANQELALGEKLSVAMSRDLPTQPLPNDPNLIDGVAHPELNYYTVGKSDNAETGVGLVYFGKRYYDHELGLFVQVDPEAAASEGLTPYHYCRNQPLAFVDPDGQAPDPVTAGVAIGMGVYSGMTAYASAIEAGASKQTAALIGIGAGIVSAGIGFIAMPGVDRPVTQLLVSGLVGLAVGGTQELATEAATGQEISSAKIGIEARNGAVAAMSGALLGQISYADPPGLSKEAVTVVAALGEVLAGQALDAAEDKLGQPNSGQQAPAGGQNSNQASPEQTEDTQPGASPSEEPASAENQPTTSSTDQQTQQPEESDEDETQCSR